MVNPAGPPIWIPKSLSASNGPLVEGIIEVVAQTLERVLLRACNSERSRLSLDIRHNSLVLSLNEVHELTYIINWNVILVSVHTVNGLIQHRGEPEYPVSSIVRAVATRAPATKARLKPIFVRQAVLVLAYEGANCG